MKFRKELGDMNVPYLALSVRQPWAWAIIHGGKDIENRSGSAISSGNMGQRAVAVHASKTMTQDEYRIARKFMLGHDVDCPRPDALIRGAIIGIITVTSVVDDHESPRRARLGRVRGQW